MVECSVESFINAFVSIIEKKSSWNSLYINADKLASEILVQMI